MLSYSSHHSHDSVPADLKKFLSLKHQQFFHYTDSSSALNMLKRYNINDNKEAESLMKWKDTYLKLWATHFCYLNDSEELISGLKSFLREFVKKRRTIITVPDRNLNKIKEKVESFIDSTHDKSCVRSMAYYPLSFCEDGNLLSQWKWYGKEGGVAIEYDLGRCMFSGDKMFDNRIPSEGFLYDISYKASEHEKIFSEYIRDRNTYWTVNKMCDRVAEEVCLLSLFMKNKSFEEEKESRLLFTITNPNEPKNLKPILCFRKKGNFVVPYIETKIYIKPRATAPIRSITIGPSENQDLTFELFFQYILAKFPSINNKNEGKITEENGCTCIQVHGIKLRRSKTPFRG